MSNTLSNAIKAANKKLFMRTAFLTSSAATLVMMGSMSQAYAQEAAAPVEEVVITGIRGALKEGLETKRQAQASVDSISAEDVGKFPDKNIAESLGRIPGVQISKGLTGEGQQVSIRGTDASLTLTQLNGQAVASTDWFVLSSPKRGFNFDLMPSEMVSGLDVYKSPLAKLDEGGIGGTVIMKTRKPLDLDSMTFYGGVEYREAELSGQDGMSYSGMGSWKNDAGTFGALLALASSDEVSARTTNEKYWSWGAGDAYFDQGRKRKAGDLTLQLKPIDELNFTLHTFHSELEANNTNYNYLVIPSAGGTGAVLPGDRGSIHNDVAGVDKGTIVGNGAPTIDPVTGWAALNMVESNTREATAKSDVYDLDGTYSGEGFTIHSQLGKTKSSGGTQKEYGAQWAVAAASTDIADYDFSKKTVGYKFRNTDPTDASEYTIAERHIGATPRTNEETYFQVDFNKDVDLGALKSFDVGAKARSSEFGKNAFTGTLTPGYLMGDSLTNYDPHNTPELNPNNRNEFSVHKFAVANPDALGDALKAGVSAYVQDKSAYGKVTEDIQAYYVQGNFASEGVSGNVGLRYVETDAENEGYDPSLTNIVKGKNSYSNLLPSFNFKADLTDTFVFRASAARTMSRANYGDLDPSFSSPNPTMKTARQGNIAIKPFLSDNTDAGLEWYFAEGSIASATIFTKSIQSFITTGSVQSYVPDVTNPGIWTVTKPVNGTGGKLEGIELQYQQDYGNGFGTQINYTYSDGTGENAGKEVDLPGNSKNSYNVTGYYENDVFSVRIAYTWREKYLTEALSLGGTAYTDDVQDLSASAIYHVTKNVDLTLEGTNLTKEVRYDLNGNGTLSSSTEVGAKYFAGVKVRF